MNNHAKIAVAVVLVASAFGDLAQILGVVAVIAFYYGRERRDAERMMRIDPHDWRKPMFWKGLWPGIWPDDPYRDFIAPLLAAIGTALILQLIAYLDPIQLLTEQLG